MSTMESTLRGATSRAPDSQAPTEASLSDRQRRVYLATAQPSGLAGRLNGVELSMPAAWRPSECIAALQGLCAQIDSLKAVKAGRGESPYGLRVLPSAPSDLRDYLETVSAQPELADALAPLIVSHGEVRDGQRLWFLGVGAARCDVIGLEQLVHRWSESIQGRAHSATAPPGLIAVQSALARAADSAEARSAMVYWNRHLDDTDRSAAIQDGGDSLGGRFDPRAVAVALPGSLLGSVSERYAVSAKTVLVAAWLVLINRITGSSRATSWQRFDGRLAPELRQFVGCLCHYLPMTQRVQWDSSCVSLVRDVERALSMHERLQDSYSSAGRLASGLQCAVRESAQPPEGVRILQTIEGGEPFRLKLAAELGARQCDIALHFNASVIREVQAQCLGEALVRVVAGLSNPSSTVAELCAPLASALAPIMEWEQRTSRPEWITGDQLGQTVLRGLATCRVLESACNDNGQSFRSRVVNRMALLRKARVGAQQQMLALVAPTSFEAAVTAVAALLAEIPVAFIDPRWSGQRKEAALERVGASMLIGTPEGLADLASPLPTYTFETLAQEESGGEVEAADKSEQPSLESVAYVVFSSGSTGDPKPIVVPRRALQNQLSWLRERLALADSDVVLHRSPLGFDAAVWELLHPVCSGATLVIPPPETGTDSRSIAREVERHSVTVLQLTPYLLRSIYEDVGFNRLESLRLVVCGGDRLPRKLATDVLAGAHFRLVNAYGPSECCIQVSIGDVEPRCFAREISSAPIGDPMPNSGMHVLSEHLEPLLDGSTGRLFLSGCPVGQGYSGDPAATASVFIPLPGQTVAGARMYDTGDLARRVGDLVEILGRADRRLKINGVRVDPSAIEKCLRELQEVRDVAVVAARDEYGTGYLTAFLVTDTPAADITAAARNLLAQSLPSTYQPAHYQCVPHLPVTDRGKIDSDALLKSAVEMVTAPVVPPRTPLERTIADVWKAVLKRDCVGIHDDFFLSGGHSLLFAQVIARLREALSLEISLRAIFLHPTIARLAEHIEGLQRESQGDGQRDDQGSTGQQ